MSKFYIVIETNSLDLDIEARAVTHMNHTKFYDIESARLEKIRKDEDLATNCKILEIVIKAEEVF